jgi:hypothetical protein
MEGSVEGGAIVDDAELTHLLEPTATQRDYLVWLIEIMEEDELKQLVLQLFQASVPLERQSLLNGAAAIVGQRRFRDGWRRRSRCIDGKRE